MRLSTQTIDKTADNHALTKPQNGQQAVNQTKTVDNEPANQNILLEQLRVKDGQIQEKDKQIKRLQEDNVELKRVFPNKGT